MLKNAQGTVPLPLLRKNEWSEIAERGFCEEARALVRSSARPRKEKGLSLLAVIKKKAYKETEVSLQAEKNTRRTGVFLFY